jgi:hypothetical protein
VRRPVSGFPRNPEGFQAHAGLFLSHQKIAEFFDALGPPFRKGAFLLPCRRVKRNNQAQMKARRTRVNIILLDDSYGPKIPQSIHNVS